MRLKQLKLAGFKSFVDPTVMTFPSQLVAVVGPNGCGKSNIIDAVRWVLGESSAKNLRGELMVDVIFNGSAQRKALGQASVELIFDNSLGRLMGQYGSYQEIAVKRLVTRDGDSSYYLNGSRCRRRDITDIFLGTGAGARSYSIIGQGTISRLVESRPEELRDYLEEAAGVSKYKERRREALSRIAHTRENLARVSDIRGELDKQLQRLERQAKAARQYTALKKEERLYRAEILALKWQAIIQEQISRQESLKCLSCDYEEQQAKATKIYQQGLLVREKLQNANEDFQQKQTSFYQLATEIARLEEAVQQHQREKIRLKADEQQMQLDWQNAIKQWRDEEIILQASKESLASLKKNWQCLQEEFLAKQKIVQEKQAQQQRWNEETEKVQIMLGKAMAEKQVEELRLHHNSERRGKIVVQLERIQQEQQSLETDSVNTQLREQQKALQNLQDCLQVEEVAYQQNLSQNLALRQQLTDTEKALHQVQDKIHQLVSQQSSLLAMQQAAFYDEQSAAIMHRLSDEPRLIETITVEKEWQHACELVLAQALQAIVFDSVEELWSEVKLLTNEPALFLTASQSSDSKANYPRLSDKIKGVRPNWTHSLNKIYTATTMEEAVEWLPNLHEEESIITKNGCWLGKGWARIAGASAQDKVGMLLRQEELVAINTTLTSAEEQLLVLKATREQLSTQIQAQEQQADARQQQLAKNYDEIRDYQIKITQQKQLLQQVQTKKRILLEEAKAFNLDLEELTSQLMTIEQLLITATQSVYDYQQAQNQLVQEKAGWEASLAIAIQAMDAAREALHQGQLRQDREVLKIQQVEENLQREQLRSNLLQERLQILTQQIIELDKPNLEYKTSLNAKIQQHGELEKELAERRKDLHALTSQSAFFEENLRITEKEATVIQEKIQQEQIQEQGLAVRATAIIETIAELDGQIEQLLAAIPTGMTQAMRESALQSINEKLTGLGAINLAAIDEYDNESQRKQYLDEQYDDLVSALAMLDKAVEKMDKETRERLRETFDAVNTSFQSLFPRLFGGGRAKLELTCDNLLEAGVTVTAQPPGKRNTSIHLLSGGEKAMTAVALVFAIFQLNPSPFCMLDEVDAPLDDANIGRFCTLVKEMSQFVQFLFITHNKVTMELADNLLGVTMHEPGVSRIVTVDVEQVLAMSA